MKSRTFPPFLHSLKQFQRFLVVQVVPVNQEYIREHHQILREFQNATLWPKHLLVHYTWKHTNPINVNWGLYFVFAIGKKLFCSSLIKEPSLPISKA